MIKKVLIDGYDIEMVIQSMFSVTGEHLSKMSFKPSDIFNNTNANLIGDISEIKVYTGDRSYIIKAIGSDGKKYKLYMREILTNSKYIANNGEHLKIYQFDKMDVDF